ncbi:MAG: hypothetical protein AABX28_01290 [Nanoarchaeota archaeon]
MPSEINFKWEIVERPGYFGKKRDKLYNLWDTEHSLGWRIAWEFGNLILDKHEALQIYEDAYYEFLKNNHGILQWLIKTASDVYDTAPSNVESRFNYDEQETPNNHLHDIAIRRAVLRNGVWFQGEHLVEVRKPGSEGEILSPYAVPFHLPHLIYQGDDIKDYAGKGFWWKTLGIERGIEHTAEEFYQHNKLLQRLID